MKLTLMAVVGALPTYLGATFFRLLPAGHAVNPFRYTGPARRTVFFGSFPVASDHANPVFLPDRFRHSRTVPPIQAHRRKAWASCRNLPTPNPLTAD